MGPQQDAESSLAQESGAVEPCVQQDFLGEG